VARVALLDDFLNGRRPEGMDSLEQKTRVHAAPWDHGRVARDVVTGQRQHSALRGGGGYIASPHS
jgi:hypothetical protein